MAQDQGRGQGPARGAAEHPMTPLAAGVVGTICLDAVQYLRYRRKGGKDSLLKREFAPADSWAKAPGPGQVAKRVIEGFTGRQLPDRWAWPVSTVAHWAYGSSAAAVYGILAGSARSPHALSGLPFGAAAWAAGYLVLPEAGICKPTWEYDAEIL
jgi:hypothetical protein